MRNAMLVVVTALASFGLSAAPALAASGGNSLTSNSAVAQACQKGGSDISGAKNAGQCTRTHELPVPPVPPEPYPAAKALCESFGGSYWVDYAWHCYFPFNASNIPEFRAREAALITECYATGGNDPEEVIFQYNVHFVCQYIVGL